MTATTDRRDHAHDFDFFVIGAGSGGVRASRIAAGLGARVGVCEARYLGGTCVNVGCVPKKLLSYGAHFLDEVDDARAYGWDLPAPPVLDWARLIATKDREIARLNGVYQRLLEARGVEILRGRGMLHDEHTVLVTADDGNTRRVTAQTILIATGGTPIRPTYVGAEHVCVSDDIFALPALPRRVVVQGGGYIGVEMASILRGYGAHVTLVYRGPLFLRGFDRDVRLHLADCLRARGIELRFHTDIVKVVANDAHDANAARFVVHLDDEDRIDADFVLSAIGRAPNVSGLGLANVGIATDDHGAIPVDEQFRTAVKTIYAVGDVIDRVQLTPVALAEGMIVARNLYGRPGVPGRADYHAVPSAVFSTPPIGTVGLSEQEAREQHGAIDIYRSTFTPMKSTMVAAANAAANVAANAASVPMEKTLMKLVIDRESQRVLGVHMVGPEAGEIVQGFAVAVKMGATKQQLDATIGIHPTAAEEFVTMREREPDPDPDHVVSVVHEDRVPRRPIVHHRFHHGDDD